MLDVSKTIQSFMEPGSFLALLLALSVLLTFLPREGAQTWGRRGVLIVSTILLLVALLPLGRWALAPLENKYADTKLPQTVEGILLLTGDESPLLTQARGGLPVAGYAGQRYLMLARLARAYPEARIVVVGTTIPLYPAKHVTTKDVSKKIIDGLGIPDARVTYEEKSRTTRENAVNAYQMIKPKAGQNWLLLTSAHHLPRAELSFEKLGWKTVPVAADYLTTGRYTSEVFPDFTRQMMMLKTAMHEYYGLVGYWLKGWIERPW